MPIAASQVFDFLEQHGTGSVDRHEIALQGFGILRRSLRKIVLKLRESDDQGALEISDQLRSLLLLRGGLNPE